MGEIIKCFLCEKTGEVQHIARHIKSVHNISMSEYYLIANNCSKPKCVICGEIHDRFKSLKFGFYETCSTNCAHKLAQTRRVEYYRKVYGVDNQFQSDIIKDKIKHTNESIYGCANVSSNPTIREKIKQTFIDNYGVDHPNKTLAQKKKIVNTNFKKYGVRYYTQTDIYKEQMNNGGTTKRLMTRAASCELMYGAKNPMQNEKVCYKSRVHGLKRKEYIFPSGKVVYVQGYEPKALDRLLLEYSETDIVVGIDNIPKIKYTIDNSEHIYFPDFFVPKDNLIVEVKSTWTLKQHEQINKIKFMNTINNGYRLRLMVYDGKKFVVDSVAQQNIEKLFSRKERGVIQGNGDNR